MTETKIKGAAQDDDLSALKISATAMPQNIALEDLILRNNVRDVSEYKLEPLIESFKRNGYRTSHPIVVHFGDDKVFEVLAGNRRTNALRMLTPDELKSVLAGTNGLVPCVVYKGLTPAQVEILRCDHGSDEDREPLSKYGLFVAVGRLLIAGLGQGAIAQRLGIFVVKEGVKKPNRSVIQVYAAAAALPDRVKAALKEYWLHGKGTIRQSDVMPLSKIWNEEWPQHGIYGKEGPKFRAKVAEIDARSPDKPEATVKALTPKLAEDRAKVMSSPVTRQLLAAAVQNDGSALASLDRELQVRDRLFRQLDWLMANKTKAIQKLLDEAETALKAADEKEAAEAAAAAEEARKTATPEVTTQPTTAVHPE